ncbi:hypothetical protein GC093_23720 [Paenibacillus sp. LMG 31456]|uniref:TnsA endonuclease N-terminal domain-containing protein n=1 Tax=Paenibacillus foliorum TaxID=2654974 RepID=A0A972H0A5_9BACL|nr:TnsA endonuclease N-terminal domain-containing protein [Paenibacillus foliorum]NOU96210.1 hypothetical protein [Paenibacillus foliorum]
MKKLELNHFGIATSRYGEDSHTKLNNTGIGEQNETNIVRPYQRVQFDAHRIDTVFSITFTTVDGVGTRTQGLYKIRGDSIMKEINNPFQFHAIKMTRGLKYGSEYWESYAPKLRRDVCFFSDLEYDHWVLIETDSIIRIYCEQPYKIPYIYNGSLTETVVDMWYLKDGINTFIEVKYFDVLEAENEEGQRARRQIKAQQTWCEENGFHHKVITEKQIRQNPLLLSNKKKILSLIKSGCINEERLRHILDILAENRSFFEINQVIPELKPSEIQLACAWLIYYGKVIHNLDKHPYGNNTQVKIKCPEEN